MLARTLALLTQKILIISDDRPGHFRQSEAIALALSRKRSVEIEKIHVIPRPKPFPRLGRSLLRRRIGSASHVLRMVYPDITLPKQAPDLIVSAGGATLPANVALARHYGVPNIFSGSLRNAGATSFAAVLTPYADLEGQPRHIVLPKPSSVDPDQMGPVNLLSDHEAGLVGPLTGALLVGGPSGCHTFSADEWKVLTGLLTAPDAGPFRWLVTNSPRTPAEVSDALAEAARTSERIIEFVDFREAGPGSVVELLARADFVVCTEDSSSMLVEGICARRPTIALQPKDRRLTPREEVMLSGLCSRHLLGQLKLEDGLEGGLAGVLKTLKPMVTNHLDDLAEAVERQLAEVALIN